MRDYLPDVNIEDLPVPLQLGIPLAMTFTCDHTFWGSPAGDLQNPSHSMGCYHSGRIIHKDVVDSVSLVNDLYGLHYARDVIAYHRGTFMSDPFPQVEWINGSPPADPNVYCDGGASHPDSHLWSLGTFGVFWPGRQQHGQPFHNLETTYAQCKFTYKGAELHGCLDTPSCSSTRAETVAGIVALCACWPVNIASDSKAFVIRFRNTMNDIKMGLPEPRWSQCNDGDLWNQIWIILRSRGPHSVRVTKVKGHATIQHLVDGAVEPIDKYCNDMADSLATYAREHRSDNMGRISDFFAQRHKYYVSFLTALHDYLLAMLKAIAEARDTHAKQARANGVSHSKVLIAPALLYPARDDPTAALDLNMLPMAAF